MGAQELALAVRVGREKERVVHLARGVAGREVELGEIIVVGLDVRPFGDRKAHVGENRDDLVHHLADRMDAAGLDAGQADRQGHVDRLALELRLERGLLQHRAPGRERFRDPILQRVDRGALRLALLGRQFAERRQTARKSRPSCRAPRRARPRARSRRSRSRSPRASPFAGRRGRTWQIPTSMVARNLLPLREKAPAQQRRMRGREHGREIVAH